MKRDAAQLLMQVVAHAGLSTQARSRSGVIFDATAEVWSYRDGTTSVHIDFGRLPPLQPDLKLSCKRLMQALAERGAPASTAPYFKALVHFMHFIAERREGFTEVEGLDFLNYKSTTGALGQIEHVKSLLRRWHRLGAAGLAHDLLATMAQVKLKGRKKGVAVATMDPVSGPLIDVELQSLQEALNEAYATASIETGAFVLAWLFMALGSRPSQFASLKVKDVHVRTVQGAVDYSIDVPRAKQQSLTRSEFKNRPLIRQLGEVVARYAGAVRVSFEGLIPDAGEAPLFPAQLKRKAYSSGFEHHATAEALGGRLTATLASLNAHSERTGTPLHVNALRLRRTFGTRAAQEGHGVLVIAELLDHTDTQHAGVYIATRPEIVQRIDKAVALELAPLAQAFRGVLIKDESAATRAGDPTSRIRDLRISTAPLASCGQHSFCGIGSPLACYTCSNFEPWLDGPHEQVLDALLAKRDRQLVTTAGRIATIHDRTIRAVAQVVLHCKEQKEEQR